MAKVKEDYAYGHIIDALAGGLYPNKFHVIREYIQNAFDAIVDFRQKTKERGLEIKIAINKPSIFIFDNGTGMNKHTLNEYRKIGFSKKKAGKFAGFRGIGKLAGISVAEKLIVTTSPKGIKEKYILEFDSESMLKTISKLKKKQDNISLNDLISKYSSIRVEQEDINAHYTFIELHKIKSDSKILFDKQKLKDYIATNAPVPFDPRFQYGKDIEEDIKNFVDDYDSVNISIGTEKVYKQNVPNLRSHKHIIVRDNKNKEIAFCWYCENINKGQIRPIENAGLIFRHKNIAIGDNYLVRKSIWDNSPHLSFYFVGEIYILGSYVLPTSQRDDFLQSDNREILYKKSKVISQELNKIARKSSDIRKAREYSEEGLEKIVKLKDDIKNNKPVLMELKENIEVEIHNIIRSIKARKKNIPFSDTKTKSVAEKAISEGLNTLKELRMINKSKMKSEHEKTISEYKSNVIYKAAIKTFKDYFGDRIEDIKAIIEIFEKNINKSSKK